jgi:hypothetical protein
MPTACKNAACWCVQAGLWCTVREPQLQGQVVPFTRTSFVSENFHRQYSSNLHHVCTYFFQKHALTFSWDNNAAFFSNKKVCILYAGAAALIRLNYTTVRIRPPVSLRFESSILDCLDNIIVSERYYNISALVKVMALWQPWGEHNNDQHNAGLLSSRFINFRKNDGGQ